jgi:hypothetical protein
VAEQTKGSPTGLCKREHAAWLEDYKRWRGEHRQALEILLKVQAAILQREMALDREAAEVHAHQLELAEYELIGCVEGPPDPEKELAKHAELARKHEDARKMHERAKARHVNLLAEINKLYALCGPEA